MYTGKRALVTGGLGFVGSSLAIRLSRLGAEVTIVDSEADGCGANPFNIEPLGGLARVIRADIAEAASFADEIRKADVIFNLAGEISHRESMRRPERDLRLNTIAQLEFLLTCRAVHRGVRVVYASTRQVYGRPQYLPVDELHPVNPVDFNGVHKFAATQYHLLLSEAGDLDAVTLRLTNVYGPRLALDAPHQGFLSAFIRCTLAGDPLSVYGDGQQQRDPVYVDDVVEAFLLAGAVERPRSRVYNVGGPDALSLAAIAEIMRRVADGPPIAFRPFPEQLRKIDIGSFVADTGRIRCELGWKPTTGFEAGIRATLDYYRRHREHYPMPQTAAAGRA